MSALSAGSRRLRWRRALRISSGGKLMGMYQTTCRLRRSAGRFAASGTQGFGFISLTTGYRQAGRGRVGLLRRPHVDVAVVQRLGARPANVPHDPEKGQRANDAVADVDLPPEKALVGRTLVVVVVVVPAFTQRDDRQEPVVPTVVGSGIAALAEQVAQRVDREGRVVH